MNTITNPDPVRLLSQLRNRSTHQIIVVTGQSGAGKTIWCTALSNAARTDGLKVAGLLSPPVFKDNIKVGIGLTDLSTGETRHLAQLRPTPLPDEPTRKWQFDNETVRWGNQVLGKIMDCDLLILDELGPLELVHGQGLKAGLDVIEWRLFNLGFVVIRPTLLQEADQRWVIDTLIDILAK